MTALKIVVGALAALAAVALAGLLSAADSAVGQLGRGRTRRLAESDARGARALEALSERPWRLSAAHALVSGGAFAFVAADAMWLFAATYAGWPGWVQVVFGTLKGMVGVFLVGEALPRAAASANPEGVGLLAAPLACTLVDVAYPVARVLSWPWRRSIALVTGDGAPEVPWMEAEDVRGRGGDEDAAREAVEDDMIEAVSDLGGKIVREVMVPRTDMVCVEDTATVEEAVATITGAGVSRLPVFHEDLDDIRGVAYAKDLLTCLSASECSIRVADHMRPALFVPETKPVHELLGEMRRKTHIAIVADEYGGTAGLVTIEDLLEEIVGEIYDEYDPEVQMVTDLGGGRWRVDARLPIEELDDRFGTAFDVEADTAGGLFSEIAGRIPTAGESIEVEGLRIVVAEMEGNRVRQLTIEPVARPAADEEG
jgi:putative hemolysin